MIESTASTDRMCLVALPNVDRKRTVDAVISALRNDEVALIKNVPATEADAMVAAVAEGFDLLRQLESQAAYATIHGHRVNVGRFFMSVQERGDYQFVAPHSEGNASVCMQLAASYAYENTTDGGFTILQHTNSASAAWERLREVVRKIDLCGRILSERELVEAKVRYSIVVPDSLLAPQDEILSENESVIEGVRIVRVLAKPVRSRSVILKEDVLVYWASIAGPDHDSTQEYGALLDRLGLLRKPSKRWDMSKLDGIDNPSNRSLVKAWRSGAKFEDLFDERIVLKLEAGDFLVFNNLTWTHSASNWTPGSGNRKVVVAFA